MAQSGFINGKLVVKGTEYDNPIGVGGGGSGIGATQVVRKTANQPTTSTTRVDVADLIFPTAVLTPNAWHYFKFFVLYSSLAAGTGIGFVFSNSTGGAVTAAMVRIAMASTDGAGHEFQGAYTGPTDTGVVATASPAANQQNCAVIEGMVFSNLLPVQLAFFSETGTQVTVHAGSHGFLWTLA